MEKWQEKRHGCPPGDRDEQERIRCLAAMGRVGCSHARILGVDCGIGMKLDGVETMLSPEALLRFRHAPDFGLILFCCQRDREPDTELLPVLQYARMLLVPGGRLALLLPGEANASWYRHLFALPPFARGASSRCARVGLLVQAGLVDIRKQVHPGCGRIISGRRPWQQW